MNSNKGFSLIELMVVVAVSSIVMMGIMQVTLGLSRSASITEARNTKTALGDAIRLQLSQKASCLNSIQQLPGSWTATTPQDIAINLGATASGPATNDEGLIAKGREMRNYGNVTVKNLQIADLRMLGAGATNSFYAGAVDLSLNSKSLNSNSPNDRFQMNKIRVAQVIFEVPTGGGAPVSCYSTNPESEVATVVDTVCTALGGTFTGGKCIPAATPTPAPVVSSTPSGPSSRGVGCATSGQGMSGPPYCVQPLSKTLQLSQVPEAERSQYYWYCPMNQPPQFPGIYWGPMDTVGIGGTVQTGPCEATVRKVAPSEMASGSVPSGSSCSHSEQMLGTTYGAAACGGMTCIDGVWMNIPCPYVPSQDSSGGGH